MVVTSAVFRFEDYSHSSAPFGIEIAMDSIWFHPAHVDSAGKDDAAGGAAAGGPRGDTGEAKPSFRQREVLVCALCAYMLHGAKLPPAPAREALGGEALRARLASSGLAVDAPAAMRLNENTCLLEPLSFALELSSKARAARTPPPTPATQPKCPPGPNNSAPQ